MLKRSEATRRKEGGARGGRKPQTKEVIGVLFRRQPETIPFRDFIYGKQTAGKRAKTGVVVPALFPVITPENLFPIHDHDFSLLMIGVGSITLAAFLERGLVMIGMTDMAEKVAGCGRIVFPIAVYGAVLWLFFSLGGL
ncbi:hypothetical protein E5Z46_06260 [Geobacillus kaustophilus NBRC 102445]|nr:hypothetical protein E5Z46_06260 [Geobacillus kaustophilus NBRC 102445]